MKGTTNSGEYASVSVTWVPVQERNLSTMMVIYLVDNMIIWLPCDGIFNQLNNKNPSDYIVSKPLVRSPEPLGNPTTPSLDQPRVSRPGAWNHIKLNTVGILIMIEPLALNPKL